MEQQIKKALETYDKYSKVYADYTSQKFFQFQINKFITLLPKNSKILDAGCGAGRDASYFIEENHETIGIDTSEGLLKEAKQRCPEGKFENMDFLKTNFEDEHFDGVWCMASLSDIPKSKTSNALSEFNRLLKQEGILFIATKIGEGEKIIIKKKYGNSPRFYSFFNKRELEGYLTKANFKIISSTTADDSGTEWVEIFAKKIVK